MHPRLAAINRLGPVGADLDRLDLALRDLATLLGDREPGEMPDIVGCWVDGQTVHLLLSRACLDPPQAWVATGSTWTLPAYAPAYTYFAGQHPPLPALATVGAEPGSQLLLDLHRLGVLSIGGEARYASDLLRHIAVELIYGIWSSGLVMTVAGFDADDTARLVSIGEGRVSAAVSVSAAIADAEALVHLYAPTPFGEPGPVAGPTIRSAAVHRNAHTRTAAQTGRLTSAAVRDGQPQPRVILLNGPSSADLSRLSRLDEALRQMDRAPVAVAMTALTPVGRWPLLVDVGQRLTVAFLDTTIQAASLPRRQLLELAAADQVVHQTSRDHVEEVPVGRHRMRSR